MVVLAVQAQPTQPQITWRGDATCPQPEGLERELAARSERALDELAPIEISVQVTRLSAGGYELSLETTGGLQQHARRVELASCSEAQRAAVVLIATALAPAPPAQAPTEEPAEPIGELPPWFLRASGLMDVRTVPQITGGLALGMGYRLLSRFQLWADARYLFARRSAVARAEIDLFALGLGGAMVWSRARFSGGPLLELEIGALRGKASQDADGSVATPWLSAWGGALAGYQLGPFGLQLAAALGVPFLRPQFSLETGGNASYSTAPLSGRVLLTLSLALGAKKSEGTGQ